jgi:hypothetical protein
MTGKVKEEQHEIIRPTGQVKGELHEMVWLEV